jgi:methylated-DNA-protein-cysteine methyltransferase-like protein
MKDGTIADGIYADMRRAILETEGVIFLADGRVNMDLCRWFG